MYTHTYPCERGARPATAATLPQTLDRRNHPETFTVYKK